MLGRLLPGGSAWFAARISLASQARASIQFTCAPALVSLHGFLVACMLGQFACLTTKSTPKKGLVTGTLQLPAKQQDFRSDRDLRNRIAS